MAPIAFQLTVWGDQWVRTTIRVFTLGTFTEQSTLFIRRTKKHSFNKISYIFVSFANNRVSSAVSLVVIFIFCHYLGKFISILFSFNGGCCTGMSSTVLLFSRCLVSMKVLWVHFIPDWINKQLCYDSFLSESLSLSLSLHISITWWGLTVPLYSSQMTGMPVYWGLYCCQLQQMRHLATATDSVPNCPSKRINSEIKC